MELSKLHFHSWGKVSNIKGLKEDTIKVIPIEYRFGDIEDVVDNANLEESDITTDDGEETISIIQNSSVSAKWLKFNSNRITAPDVRRGSDVMIWRMGDTDIYYWSDMDIANVKRLETVVHAWSADPNEPMKDDLSNAYFLEVSTHNKTITLQTSQANEEPYGYTLQLNTDEGVFVLKDTDNNEVYLNSKDTVIGAKNANGTEFNLDKKNIYGYAPDSIDFTAKNSINFKCTDFTISASKSISFDTTAWSVNASATIAFTTKTWTATATTIGYTATAVTVAAPVTTCTGLLKCAGLSVGGAGAEPAGDCEIAGNLTVTGTTNVTGLFTATAIICDTIAANTGTFKSHGPH